MLELFARPEMRRLLIARFFFDPVFYFYMFWIPQYLSRERGMSLATIGSLTWIPFFALGITNIAAGRISDSLVARGWEPREARLRLMLIAALLTPASGLAALAGTPAMAITLMSILMFAHGIWIANFITLIARHRLSLGNWHRRRTYRNLRRRRGNAVQSGRRPRSGSLFLHAGVSRLCAALPARLAHPRDSQPNCEGNSKGRSCMSVSRRKPRTARHRHLWRWLSRLLETVSRPAATSFLPSSTCWWKGSEATGVQVTNFGMVDKAETAYALLPRLKAADLDLVFCDMLTYATSASFAAIVRGLDVPIVLVALQPLAAMDYAEATTHMQLANDDFCSVPEFTGVAIRMGKQPPPVILGTLA